MNWILLKPSLPKIIIFIIVFVIFVPFIEPHGIYCIKAPCPQPGTQSLLTQFLFLKNPIVGISYINLFIGLIASYVVSCLIIFVVNKFNRGK